MQHNCHTYHTYNSKHTCHTYHTYHTSILFKHAIPDRPYTPYIPNIPYHTPTTPQGGGGQYHTPTTPQGGRGKISIWDPSHAGGGGRGGWQGLVHICTSCCADTGAWGVAWIHIFAYYVGFEWRKGLVRNQADLHCSVTCCRLFCSKEKASLLAPFAGYEPDVPFCAVTSAVSFRSACPKRAAKTPRPTFKNAMLCTHPFTGPVTCPEASVPQPTWKKNKALPPTPGRPRSRIGLQWQALTRLPTWTHADVRKSKSHTYRALTQTNTDPRGDRFLHRRRHWCGPTRTQRGPLPALTRTPTRTHAGLLPGLTRTPTRTHAGPPQRRPQNAYGATRQVILLQGCAARVGPRGSALVSASVRGRVPAWVRVGPRWCPRQCPRQCGDRGLAWVRVGPRQCPRGCGRLEARVGPRGSASVSASAWVRVGPRGSAWVRVSGIRVSVRPVSASVPGAARVGRGSASVSVWVRGTKAPRGSAWVRVIARVEAGRGGTPWGPAWVRVGPHQCPHQRGEEKQRCWFNTHIHTHTHFATAFCGKNIGPEFDTGTRQALCTATVPPKRL